MKLATHLVSNYFAKLWECDASSRRFYDTSNKVKKRCEDAPHSKSASRENSQCLG